MTLAASSQVDLAPSIYRQRLVIEATCDDVIGSRAISDYLTGLSDVCDMALLMPPVTHYSGQYGWAGWVHWETSGAHMYAWERPIKFFSVDIYTCKSFNPDRAVAYTVECFSIHEIVSRGF